MPRSPISYPAGTRFNYLEIIKELAPRESTAKDGYIRKERKFLCKCSCGNETEVWLKRLKDAKVKQCKACAIQARKADITNQRFGLLTARFPATKRGGRWYWKCDCNCGQTHEVTVSDLRSGNTNSCGCNNPNQRYANTSPKWRGFGQIPQSLWGRMQRQALKRSINFNITIKDAWSIFQSQQGICALSGKTLTFPKSRKDSNYTASFDRVDSFKGYSKENCQWVHKDIQMSKWTHTQEHFIELCQLVTAHQKGDKHATPRLIQEK